MLFEVFQITEKNISVKKKKKEPDVYFFFK